MSLETKVRFQGGVAVIDLDGRLAFASEGQHLRDTLVGLFEQGHTHLLVNLAGLQFADSGGLGDLVAAYAAITRRGGVIKLLEPQGKILAMLRTTHIDALFEICSGESAAIASFPAGGAEGPGDGGLLDD